MPAHWELVATLAGGTVSCLVRVDGVVLAATPAGVRQSTDSGRSWSVLGAGVRPAPEVIAASPAFASDGLLLAGTADGLLRSQDAGQTWQATLVGSRVLSIAFSPAFHRDGLVLVGTEQDGVLRSDDRGRTWTSGNPGLLDLTVLGLACSPAFEVDQSVFAATSSGVFRSPNAGRAWREIASVPGEPAVQALALSPRFPSSPVILVGTEADGLLRSTDGGTSWCSVEALAGRSVTALAWWNDTDVAVGSDLGVLASEDRGATWSRVGPQLGPVLCLAVASDGGLLAGLPRTGVARSPDRVSWETADAGLQANLAVSIAFSPEFERDHTVYLAGLEDGVSISSDAGATWESANAGLGPDTAVFELTAGPEGVYAATGAGVFQRRRGVEEWKMVHPGAARAVRADGPRVVAVGMSGALVACADAAGAWQPLEWPTGAGQPKSVVLAGSSRLVVTSADPTRSEVAVWQSSDVERWQRLLAERAPDAAALAAPLAAASDGAVFVGVGDTVLRGVQAADQGWLWHRTGLPATVTSLAASPAYGHDATVLAATSAGVYISRDGGLSFQPSVAGMGAVPVVAVALSPAYDADRLVYAVELGGRIWRNQGR